MRFSLFQTTIKFSVATITLLPLLMVPAFEGCTPIVQQRTNPAVRFIAFGDSATNGPEKSNYPDLLAEKMGMAPNAFVNEGRGGENTRQGLLRLGHLLAKRFYPGAAVLLYWQGGKDVMEFIQKNDPLLVYSPADAKYPFREAWQNELNGIQQRIEEALRIAAKNGLKVYVATYYPIQAGLKCKAAGMKMLSTTQAAIANVYVSDLNDRIRLAAKKQNAVLVDVAVKIRKIGPAQKLYDDSVHLNERGHHIVADCFMEAILAHEKQNSLSAPVTESARTSSSPAATLPQECPVLQKDALPRE
jgi:lysophospholipase L1-like esterase